MTRRRWAAAFVGLCLGLPLLPRAPLSSAALHEADGPRLTLWQRDAAGLLVDGRDEPLAVGSLQKPFIAAAWASSHAGAAPPRLVCGRGSGCWLRGGHGELGLAEALSRSCNTYFRVLAADTPPPALREAFLEAGFDEGPGSPAQALGLQGQRPLRIRPSRLLEAYARLVREPWTRGESIRQALLAGLREAPLSGTAAELGLRGYWAKTGTAPKPDGLRTTGFTLVVEEGGWSLLARLDPGTGRETAAALGPPLARMRPGHGARAPSPAKAPKRREVPSSRVRVRLFDLLGPLHPRVRNLSGSPIPCGRGFLGPNAEIALEPGQLVGPGLLEIRDARTGLRRRLLGTVRGEASERGLRLEADLDVRDYVDGVVAAELPAGSAGLRAELGAAVLRFLAKGPRHADADVCDSTHCAWFVGRGPLGRWTASGNMEAAAWPAPGFEDAAWARVVASSKEPGPDQWTAHCGGAPLSPHAVWGGEDASITPCPRHGASASRPWTRDWSARDLRKAFGGVVESLDVAREDGVWILKVQLHEGQRTFIYDEAHRRLARVLGWGSLPSPAEGIESIEGGFRARGVGLGHRVGLCLGD